MIRAKKHLGQHFLNSQSAINAIVEAGEIKKTDIILEIGPGRGILTTALLTKAKQVIAVEKDVDLMPELQNKFSKEITSGRLYLISQDVLNLNFEKYRIKTNGYKLIANIPYYITGQIFRKFLETQHQPNQIVVLIQKEVAERIIAKDKKESLLSLSVKAYGEPKIIKVVKAGSFSPPPKVDSAILAINNISKKFFSDLDEKTFFHLIHLGFAHKRKQLVPNLAQAYNREKIISALEKLRISKTIRAEDLSIDNWQKLANYLSQKIK